MTDFLKNCECPADFFQKLCEEKLFNVRVKGSSRTAPWHSEDYKNICPSVSVFTFQTSFPWSNFPFPLLSVLTACSLNTPSLIPLFVLLPHVFPCSPSSLLSLSDSSFLSAPVTVFSKALSLPAFPSPLSLDLSPLFHLPLFLSNLFSYHTNTFGLYNLCVAPLPSLSYLIFCLTLLCKSMGKIWRFKKSPYCRNFSLIQKWKAKTRSEIRKLFKKEKYRKYRIWKCE